MSDPNEPTARKQPATDAEWTIHSLNIHGVFFQKWCEHALESNGRWKVTSTEYPVAFGDSKHSKLDIRAELRTGDNRVSLLVECKKNNPDLSQWVFFRRTSRPTSESNQNVHMLHLRPCFPLRSRWSTHLTIWSTEWSMPYVELGRETREDYQPTDRQRAATRTKTANASIEEAAAQVALATRMIIAEEDLFSRTLAMNPKAILHRMFERAARATSVKQVLGLVFEPPYRNHLFFPVIITTAKLYVCEFDPKNVNGTTGEIPFENTALLNVPWVIYDYGLPRELAPRLANDDLARKLAGDDDVEILFRMNIAIVHSASLPDFLSGIERIAAQFHPTVTTP